MAAEIHRGTEHQVSGTTILYATIASLIVGGPLLGMAGFALLATATLVLITGPLMLLFSPIIIPAGLVLAAAMAAFGAAAAAAFVGVSALTWTLRSVGGFMPGIMGRVRGADKQQGLIDHFGGYLQQKGQAYEPRLWPNKT